MILITGCGLGLDWRYRSYGLRIDYMGYEPQIEDLKLKNSLTGIFFSLQPDYTTIGAEYMFSFFKNKNSLILAGGGIGARLGSLSAPQLFFQSKGFDITGGLEFEPYYYKTRKGSYFAFYLRPYILWNISRYGMDLTPCITGGFHLYIPEELIESLRRVQ